MNILKPIIILLAPIAAVGCSKERNCNLDLHYGDKFANSGYTTVYCDSFQMESLTKATVWVDGTEMTVYAERFITPYCKSKP